METVLAVPALSDNYIWVLQDESGRAAVVVDPGEARPAREAIERAGSTLAGVMVTHHHGDHTAGIETLLSGLDLPVWGPAGERIPRRTVALSDGQEAVVESLGLTFQVMAVPGHTRGHIAYYGGGMLFCGDTLFAGGCGRLFEGTAAQMRASLNRVAALPPDTRVYAGHEYTEKNLTFAAAVEAGNEAVQQRLRQVRQLRRRAAPTLPSTLAEETATNPFLRCEVAAVRESAERYAQRPLDSPDAVFAALRQWRDSF